MPTAESDGSEVQLPAREGETPARFAELLGVSPGTVYRWVRQGKLTSLEVEGRLVIPFEPNSHLVLERINDPKYHEFKAWVPEELEHYNKWHELLDELVWLLKVCYSSPAEIRAKRFRLDAIYANYLQYNQLRLRPLRGIFPELTESTKRLVIDDLKRAWYNELAFAFPLRTATLGMSFADIGANKSSSARRFTFPSWRVITGYYAFYFYARATTLLKQSSFRLQEHGATIASFKHNLFPVLRRVAWCFPLDIAYLPSKRESQQRALLQNFPHLQYGYCAHPRAPYRAPLEVLQRIRQTFRRRGRRRPRHTAYMLFDFLHDFRVWANYLDIDSLLSLWGPGYRAFLDQNLSAILFFVGGIAELCFIAVVGEEEYALQLEKLYDLLIMSSADFERDFRYTPLYQRAEILHELGVLGARPQLKERPDANVVQPLSKEAAFVRRARL